MTTIEQEREAFEGMLEDLLVEHPGAWAIVRDRELVGVLPSFGEAYAIGVERFGPDGVFLVAQIRRGGPEPVSVAWSTGVMFG